MMSGTNNDPWQALGGPGALGGAAGPLAGVRILDLSSVLSGPLATALLAGQGAAVIKIEGREGDTTRRIGPAKGALSAMFVAANHGKRCLGLDLKQPAARAVLLDLLRQADVLVENMRPGAMDRLGLSHAALRAVQPRLVQLSITGYGPDGPDAGARVYDTVIQARSGFCAANPHPQTGEPMLLPATVCDKITALTAAQAVTAALFARERDGQGRHVLVAMLDAALAFQWPDAMYNHVFLDDAPPPMPEFAAGQRPWAARDGHFTTNTPQQSEFEALCRVLGVPDLPKDPRFASTPARMRHGREIREHLAPLAAQHDTDALVARLIAADVPACRVNRREDLALDAQIAHNAVLHEVALGDAGRARLPRGAARFDGQARAPAGPAGRIGEDTRAVLTALGRSADEIAQLLAAGAALAPPDERA